MRRIQLALAGLLALGGCGGTPTALPPPPPVAAITSISPSFLIAGSPAQAITVMGTGFTSASQVLWNGSPRTTRFNTGLDGTPYLSTDLAPSDMATLGAVKVSVATAGAATNAMTYYIVPAAQATAGPAILISAATDGGPGDGESFFAASLSPTARFVAFQSTATDLVPGPASGFADIYERDTCIGAPAGCVPTTTRVSVANDGTLPNNNSRSPSVSADGRYVVFDSSATNLVAGDTRTNGDADVFLADTCVGIATGCVPGLTRVSSRPDGGQTNEPANNPSISADGRLIIFDSFASDLMPSEPTFAGTNVFVYDSCHGAPAGCTPTMSIASLSSGGAVGASSAGAQAISGNDRYVAFESWDTSLVGAGPNQNMPNIYIRDTCFGAGSGCTPSLQLATLTSDGSRINGNLSFDTVPTMSASGRYVPFSGFATNIAAGAGGTLSSVFLRDTCIAAPSGCAPSTILVNPTFDGSPVNGSSGGEFISPSGRFIAFDSLANNLVPGDTEPPNAFKFIYLRDTCNGGPVGCVPSTICVSVGPLDIPALGLNSKPSISADDHWVAFLTNAQNLATAGNGHTQIVLAKSGY